MARLRRRFHDAHMDTRHLLRIASITSAAFLGDVRRHSVERRKTIAQPWRGERRLRTANRAGSARRAA